MTYDENLAQRVRNIFGRQKVITEKKMFGGLAFMLRERMCCGIIEEKLVVRVGPEQHDSALSEP